MATDTSSGWPPAGLSDGGQGISTGWPPAGLSDGGQGISTGWPAAPLPDVLNNLLMVNNTIPSVAGGQPSQNIVNTGLKATAVPDPRGAGFTTPTNQIQFKWISGTLSGTAILVRNAVTLAAGSTFTQADIDANLMDWTPDAGIQSDALVFTVTDLEHGGVIPVTITFAST